MKPLLLGRDGQNLKHWMELSHKLEQRTGRDFSSLRDYVADEIAAADQMKRDRIAVEDTDTPEEYEKRRRTESALLRTASAAVKLHFDQVAKGMPQSERSLLHSALTALQTIDRKQR
jgi:hypothetical protein